MFKAGQWDTGVRLLEPTLKKQRVICGLTHPDTLATMHNLAMCYGFQNRFAKSMALHEELLDASNPRMLPTVDKFSHGELCLCLSTGGQFDNAEQLLRKVLEQDRKREDDSLGKRNRISNSLGFLAVNELLTPLRRRRNARSRSESNEAIRNASPLLLDERLGAAILGQHKYADAEPLLLQGYEGMKQRELLLFATTNFGFRSGRMGRSLLRGDEPTDKGAAWREKVPPKKEH